MQISESRLQDIQSLVDALIACDDSAWGEFLREIGPMLRGFCARAGLSEDDIEDIAQTVVLKILENNAIALRNLRISGSRMFYGWVRVVISRAVLDHIRNRNTRRKYETAWTESQPTETDSARDPSDVAEARILIDQAASRLSEEERTLFWMSYWQVPHEEIARITGLSRTAVQQRIFRLRKKLGKEFSGSDGNPE